MKFVRYSKDAIRQLQSIRKSFPSETTYIYQETEACLTRQKQDCSIIPLGDGTHQLNLEGSAVIFEEHPDHYLVLRIIWASWPRTPGGTVDR